VFPHSVGCDRGSQRLEHLTNWQGTLSVPVRPRCMGPSAAGRVAVWTAAISASAFDPHAAPFALGCAVAKELFDLLRARLQEGSVLSYLRGTRPATSLRIGPSPGSPALVLNVGPQTAMPPDDGSPAGPAESGSGYPADLYPSADQFCIKQRGELLAYAIALTRNLQDAEDAVSHVVQKIYEPGDEYRLAPTHVALNIPF
jgi:hypothetical protein